MGEAKVAFLLGELAPECQPSISSGWISMRSDLFKPSEEEGDDNCRKHACSVGVRAGDFVFILFESGFLPASASQVWGLQA